MNKYRKISISEKVYELLVKLRDEKGFASISDTIMYVVHAYYDFIARQNCSTDATIGSTCATHGSKYATTRNKPEPKRKTMRDIIAERKVQLLSEVKPRDPEAFLGKAERLGIVVLRGEKDTALVDPGFWEEFREEILPHLPCDPDGWENISGAVKKLAEFLHGNGLMYCSRDNGWILL